MALTSERKASRSAAGAAVLHARQHAYTCGHHGLRLPHATLLVRSLAPQSRQREKEEKKQRRKIEREREREWREREIGKEHRESRCVCSHWLLLSSDIILIGMSSPHSLPPLLFLFFVFFFCARFVTRHKKQNEENIRKNRIE